MSGTLDAGERIIPAIPSSGHTRRNDGIGTPGRATQFEAMIFDDQNGGLVGLKQYHARELRKEARLRFDPAAWTVPAAPIIDRKDDWLVEV
jgi:hypothetical protein